MASAANPRLLRPAWVLALALIVGPVAPAHPPPPPSDLSTRLAALRTGGTDASSAELLRALGDDAASVIDPLVRIDAWLFAAEGLSERASAPAEGAVYARKVLQEPGAGSVDRGRAVAVITTALVLGGEEDAAIALATQETAHAPGLAA